MTFLSVFFELPLSFATVTPGDGAGGSTNDAELRRHVEHDPGREGRHHVRHLPVRSSPRHPPRDARRAPHPGHLAAPLSRGTNATSTSCIFSFFHVG